MDAGSGQRLQCRLGCLVEPVRLGGREERDHPEDVRRPTQRDREDAPALGLVGCRTQLWRRAELASHRQAGRRDGTEQPLPDDDGARYRERARPHAVLGVQREAAVLVAEHHQTGLGADARHGGLEDDRHQGVEVEGRRQRVTETVEVGPQRVAAALELGDVRQQLVGHVVERSRQPAHLVRATYLDRLREVTRRHRLGSVGHLLERAGEVAGDGDRGDDGDDEGDQGHQEHGLHQQTAAGRRRRHDDVEGDAWTGRQGPQRWCRLR